MNELHSVGKDLEIAPDADVGQPSASPFEFAGQRLLRHNTTPHRTIHLWKRFRNYARVDRAMLPIYPFCTMTGKLITFEGPEGGGKSTQARLLTEYLRSKGIRVLTTREPGGTPTGEIIRDLLQNDLSKEPLCDATEALLFCASRAQLCSHVLAPALERGDWIVLDRFTDSTLAYQGYGRGFDVERLRVLNAFATGPVTPVLTFLLDIPVQKGLERAIARSGNKDRIESAPVDFHQRLRDGYLEMARKEPGRFAIVNATQPIECVSAEIRRILHTRLDIPGVVASV